MFKYNVSNWKSQKENCNEYWNDNEVDGVFHNIDSSNFSYMERYIEEQGFIEDFGNCLKSLTKLGKKLAGSGAELGAGTMWLSSYIINTFQDQINQLYAIDYSENQVMNLGQKLLNHYKVSPEKISLCIGSFYDIQLFDNNLDFILMSQAFHHADNPDKLLKEAHRVLKNDGFLIMIGELYIPKSLFVKCYINYMVSLFLSSIPLPKFILSLSPTLRKYHTKKLQGSFQEMYFPSDPITGDHYHLKSQYEQFFMRNKFQFVNIESKLSNHLAYILYK